MGTVNLTIRLLFISIFCLCVGEAFAGNECGSCIQNSTSPTTGQHAEKNADGFGTTRFWFVNTCPWNVKATLRDPNARYGDTSNFTPGQKHSDSCLSGDGCSISVVSERCANGDSSASLQNHEHDFCSQMPNASLPSQCEKACDQTSEKAVKACAMWKTYSEDYRKGLIGPDGMYYRKRAPAVASGEVVDPGTGLVEANIGGCRRWHGGLEAYKDQCIQICGKPNNKAVCDAYLNRILKMVESGDSDDATPAPKSSSRRSCPAGQRLWVCDGSSYRCLSNPYPVGCSRAD